MTDTAKPLSVNELADFMADISRFKTSAARLLATIDAQQEMLRGIEHERWEAVMKAQRLERIEAAAREVMLKGDSWVAACCDGEFCEAFGCSNIRELVGALRDVLEGR